MPADPSPDPDLVAAALADAGERFADRPTLIPLPGGASRDSWLIATDRRHYVLKRDPLHERTPLTSRQNEYRAALAAEAAGVPVPRPVCFEPAGGRFASAGMITEFVPGTASPNQIQTLTPATDLVREIGRAAGQLAHATVPTDRDSGDSTSAVSDPVGSVLAELAGGLDFLAPDRPVLAAAYRWLELNRPTVSRTVLVHGDFRLGNFMVGEGGLTGVIDWEFAALGCPGQDLGFFCLRPWRFERDGLRAGGLGGLPELLDGYAETAPEPLDAATVGYWEIVGQLRWGLYCLMQEWTFRQGGHRHLERFVIGRRIAEVEWDLMDLLEETA
ncbi:phosphotransferase family protein [Nocardia sp. CDC160]|uniref:phosphotransferase family protein n=1 Tax=Nocardia sp. CDC160 TaxID=3112166 RepID=UPI002DB70959|nr:phosphotransferase family protein [Nocardia sp. CDC160]MEC3919373.1 phosphotransferase family protein [Nocardia sp. CDC160]